MGERHYTKSDRDKFDHDKHLTWSQDSSTPPPSCVESFCQCRLQEDILSVSVLENKVVSHLQEDVLNVSILGSKGIKNTTLSRLSGQWPRIHSTTPLPYENSVGQGVNTALFKLLTVPVKNHSPILVLQLFND